MSWLGPQGSAPIDERKAQTEALKRRVLQAVAEGLNSTEIRERFGISRQTLTEWKRAQK